MTTPELSSRIQEALRTRDRHLSISQVLTQVSEETGESYDRVVDVWAKGVK